MDDKIIAVVKKPYCKPETVAIEKGLASLQEIVGGDIDAADLPEMNDVFGFCNAEGLLIGLEPNVYRPEYGDALMGPVVFVGTDEDGRSVSLAPEQAKKVTAYLEANSVKDLGEFLFNINTGFEHYKPKKQNCM